MKLILPVYKDDPNAGDWLEGFDCAVVEMDADLAQHYLALMDRVTALHAEVPSLVDLRLFDYHVEWYAGDDDAELLDFEGDEVPPPLFGAEPSRTEVDRVYVGHNDITWSCYPKHADIRVTTSRVSRKLIDAIASAIEPGVEVE